MSTSKLDRSGVFQTVNLQANDTRLTLPANAVRICKNGIEFRSGTPISMWKEMTVDLFCSAAGNRVHCTGVVVSCDGNRHSGYLVSMVFMNLSRQARHHLDEMAGTQA